MGKGMVTARTTKQWVIKRSKLDGMLMRGSSITKFVGLGQVGIFSSADNQINPIALV